MLSRPSSTASGRRSNFIQTLGEETPRSAAFSTPLRRLYMEIPSATRSLIHQVFEDGFQVVVVEVHLPNGRPLLQREVR
jgi:hypothetical protein